MAAELPWITFKKQLTRAAMQYLADMDDAGDSPTLVDFCNYVTTTDIPDHVAEVLFNEQDFWKGIW